MFERDRESEADKIADIRITLSNGASSKAKTTFENPPKANNVKATKGYNFEVHRPMKFFRFEKTQHNISKLDFFDSNRKLIFCTCFSECKHKYQKFLTIPDKSELIGVYGHKAENGGRTLKIYGFILRVPMPRNNNNKQ